MTDTLPARVETFTCGECDRSWPSALAANRCEQLDLAGDD